MQHAVYPERRCVMLCMNPRCRKPLSEYQWGEGYCSGECMEVCLDKGDTLTQSLHDPSANLVTISFTQDEIEAFEEVAEIDYRLPRIIYLRRAGHTYREIGKSLDLDASTCNRMMRYATRKLLRRCGLRRK